VLYRVIEEEAKKRKTQKDDINFSGSFTGAKVLKTQR